MVPDRVLEGGQSYNLINAIGFNVVLMEETPAMGTIYVHLMLLKVTSAVCTSRQLLRVLGFRLAIRKKAPVHRPVRSIFRGTLV